MGVLNPYLTFNGNCRKAMTFYKKCLGGKLVFQTAGKSPHADKMPAKMKDCIVHSELRNESFILLGSDMVDEDGQQKGNSVSLLLDCNSGDEIRKFYIALSKGGRQTQQLQPTFWGATFGTLTDKFGINWILNYSKK